MPLLSIVIPAYNEANRLPHTLEQVFAFLDKQTFQAEVLVVENASTDNTLDLAREFARSRPDLRVLHTPGKGKGLAVRQGMLEATGDFRFMCDADLSMPIEQVLRFLPPNLRDADVAVASREIAGAVRHNEPLRRHLGGRLVNFVIRSAILPGLQDTQCGFKSFTAAAARDLFGSQQLTGWAFDVELLHIARKRGYRIREIPIDWNYRSDSKVRPVQDAFGMCADILKIRANDRRGLYAPRDA